MSDGYRQADIICPFFKEESTRARNIRCEGITDFTSVALSFGNHEQDRRLHINIFCADHYKNCEIFRMIMEKYE